MLPRCSMGLDYLPTDEGEMAGYIFPTCSICVMIKHPHKTSYQSYNVTPPLIQLNWKMPVTKKRTFSRVLRHALTLERTWMCILSPDAHLSHVQSQVAWWTFWYNFSQLRQLRRMWLVRTKQTGCSEENAGVLFLLIFWGLYIHEQSNNHVMSGSWNLWPSNDFMQIGLILKQPWNRDDHLMKIFDSLTPTQKNFWGGSKPWFLGYFFPPSLPVIPFE